jgi:uncharacterized RDD family membrane protein YckC
MASAQGEVVRFGGFWLRAIALLIDTTLLTAATIAVTLLGNAVGWLDPTSFNEAFAVLSALYFVGLWWRTGQTIGMMPFRMFIVTDSSTNRRLPMWRAGTRWLSLYFIAFPFFAIGVLWVLGEGKKRGWHDLISGSVVIRDPGVRPLSSRAYESSIDPPGVVESDGSLEQAMLFNLWRGAVGLGLNDIVPAPLQGNREYWVSTVAYPGGGRQTAVFDPRRLLSRLRPVFRANVHDPTDVTTALINHLAAIELIALERRDAWPYGMAASHRAPAWINHTDRVGEKLIERLASHQAKQDAGDSQPPFDPVVVYRELRAAHHCRHRQS